MGFRDIFKSVKQSFAPKREEGVVGVDIGSSSIKVAELHSNNEVPTLSTYGELQLGPYAEIGIGRTTDLEVATLAQALIDIIRESSVSTKDVALSISYNASFTTVVTLETTDPQEIARRVPTEAKKYIPVPMNTVSLDWFTIGSSADSSTSRVLIAAIHNESLKKYHATVTGAGLGASMTEIEIFSTIRSAASRNDSTVAVLDFGANGTRLYVAENGMLAKSHSVRVGGAQLTSHLAETLGISFDEAEELKRRGVSNDSEEKKAIDQMLERGLKEIAQVLRRYEKEGGGEIEKIIISGGGALLVGIDTMTEDVLGKPVEKSNPFSKVAYPAFLEDVLTEAGPVFSVAVGAALQRLTNNT